MLQSFLFVLFFLILLSFCAKEPSLKVGEVTYRLFDRVVVKINVDKSSTENKFLSFSIISKKVLIEDRDRILFLCFLKGLNIDPKLQTTLKVMFTLCYRMVKFWRLESDLKTEPPCTAQLKELCHRIYQILNGGNCHKMKRNMKITVQILKASLFVEVRQHDTFLHQMEAQKKSELPMGYKPTTLRDLVGRSNHWAPGDSMASKGEMWVFD